MPGRRELASHLLWPAGVDRSESRDLCAPAQAPSELGGLHDPRLQYRRQRRRLQLVDQPQGRFREA